MDKCPRCGTKVSDWSQFCQKCGKKLKKGSEPEHLEFSGDPLMGKILCGIGELILTMFGMDNGMGKRRRKSGQERLDENRVSIEDVPTTYENEGFYGGADMRAGRIRVVSEHPLPVESALKKSKNTLLPNAIRCGIILSGHRSYGSRRL